MTTPQTFYHALVSAISTAHAYNIVDQARPAAVLWPDKERQWEPLITRLQTDLPLLVLGTFDTAKRNGPAIWLRCMVDRTVEEADWPEEQTPILYLPGISKQELRAVEDCPKHLQPLAELQYRGVLWTQKNGKDWTVGAFLQSADKGLNIEVAADAATREATLRALEKLADEPVEELRKDAPLTAARFNALLNPEPVKNLLLWLNSPNKRRAEIDAPTWSAFRADCKQHYGFDPETDGPITAAALLGGRQNAWNAVWNRYAEAPRRYPELPDLLRKAKPAKPDGLFYVPASWPQENEAKEATLRERLLSLEGKSVAEALDTLRELDKEHGPRRNWVWSELEMTLLAGALPALVTLAEGVAAPLSGPQPQDFATAYTSSGWKVDSAALEALAGVESMEDVAAVKMAVRALYLPWLQSGAEAFQKAVAQYPFATSQQPGAASQPKPGRCLLFADGLRYDLANLLSAALESKGLSVTREWRFGALPGVTPTAKPAVAPVAPLLGAGPEFQATVRSDGAKVTADVLRRELAGAGYTVLTEEETGEPSGSAWTECGSLDAYGHAQGWKLARRVREEIRGLVERIQALLTAGWQEVRIVTDHGWLLMPGGLPSVDLPLHLTDARKGRCARLKSSATFGGQTVWWHWDGTIRIAVAPGIATYIAGKEYEHGGLSPQECVLPVLTVTASAPATPAVSIGDVKWTGLRCRAQIVGAVPGLSADLRQKAMDASTTLAESVRPVREGQVSLAVADDSQEGNSATLVILDSDGNVLALCPTIIGPS